MTAYAIKLFREARGLTPTPTNEEITQKLAIVGGSITSLESLLELLDRFDKPGPINFKRSENISFENGYDNWRIKNGNPAPHTQHTKNYFNQKRENDYRKGKIRQLRAYMPSTKIKIQETLMEISWRFFLNGQEKYFVISIN